MANYYDILGVPRGADQKEIRQAFRRLARKYHPDLNPGDEKAERRFKQINEAYEVLSDPDKRKKYDLYGERRKRARRYEADSGFDLFGGLEDLFDPFRRRAGTATATRRRVEAPVTVTLEEAYSGTKRHVTVTARGGELRVEVTIPPGVDTGSVVHISLDKGNDLYLTVKMSPYSAFQRKGNDLYTEVQVPFEDALLGGEAEVRTLKGRVRLTVPPESQNGQRVRLAGQGMPKLGKPQTRGDMYVILRPVLPKGLTGEERGLIEKFKELRSRRR